MHCTTDMLVPSLQHMATVRIALTLIMDPEFRKLQLKHKSPLYNLSEDKWEHLVKEKLPPSNFPIELQRKVTAAIRPINYETIEWSQDHSHIFNNKIYPFAICWKSDGTINRLETAYRLIRNQHFDLETRFGLACHYCCSSDIFEFWKLIPDPEKISLCDKYMKENPRTIYEKNVFTWLIQLIKAGGSDILSLRNESLVLEWNIFSLFNDLLNELTPHDRQSILKRTLLTLSKIPVVRFCFSRLTAEEQIHMLLQYPYEVLRIYLFWPLQNQFPNAATQVVDVLSNSSFLYLIHIIICQKILPEWKDSNYVDILKKFWCESPKRCKDHVKKFSIFDILTTILEGKRFRSPLRSGVYQKYLVHGKTVVENADVCAFFSDRHRD